MANNDSDASRISAAREAVRQSVNSVDFREYVDVLWRRRWLFVFLWTLVVVLNTLYTLHERKIYSAQTTLVIADRSASGGSNSSVGEALISSLSNLTSGLNLQTQVALIQSPDLLQSAFQKMSPYERSSGYSQKSAFGDPPGWAVAVEGATNTQMITVSTKAYSPAAAQAFADLIASTYLERDRDRTVQATAQGVEFVTSQLKTMRLQLMKSTQRLADFERANAAIAPDQEVEKSAAELFSLRGEEHQAQVELDQATADLKVTKAQLRSLQVDERQGYTLSENPDFTHLRDETARLNDLLIVAEQEYRPGRPEVTRLKDQIDQDRKQLQKLAHSIVTQTVMSRNPLVTAALSTLAENEVRRVSSVQKLRLASSLLAQREQQYKQFPEKLRQYGELKLTSEQLAHTYGLLSDRYYELLITEKSGIPNALIASKARLPGGPSSPNVSVNLLAGAIAGLLLSILTCLLVDQADSRVRDPGAVERILGLTVLSAVPESTPDDGGSSPLIDHVENNHTFLEAFRLLRNNIVFSMPDSVTRAIAVTSAAKGDGKSTIAANLAIAFGLDGKKVLLVDGDLRRPSVHKTMSVAREVGFSNVVTKTATLDEAISKTLFENVDALTSGPLPPRPNEFLNSESSRAVIAIVAEKYDVVIIDCPPCTGISDFQIISSMVDGAVLVVGVERTAKQFLEAAARVISQTSVPMLGTVLNRVVSRWSPYGSYSYYYYYSYYGEEEDKPKKRKGRKSPSSRT